MLLNPEFFIGALYHIFKKACGDKKNPVKRSVFFSRAYKKGAKKTLAVECKP